MNILLPTDEQFVEQIAKALGRDRLRREAFELLKAAYGSRIGDEDSLDAKFDIEFNKLWNGTDEECTWNRENYREDAITAINTINLLLLTMT